MSRTVSLCPWCHVHRGRGFKERKGAAGHWMTKIYVSLEDVGAVRRYLLQIIWGSKKVSMVDKSVAGCNLLMTCAQVHTCTGSQLWPSASERTRTSEKEKKKKIGLEQG